MTQTPEAALAAGGGRMGGSSFSSSRSSGGGGRSYSAPSYSGPSRSFSSPSFSAPYYAPSPFAPAPFYGGYGAPYVVGPSVAVGGGGGIFNFVFFSVAALFLFQFVNSFISDRSQGSTLLGSATKVSVARVQVGLLGLARNLQQDLDRIADRADTSSKKGLHYILTETVMALLRNPDYCVYGYSATDVKRDVDEAERRFNQVSMEERSKFESETLVNVNSNRRRMQRPPMAQRFTSEYIVVTLLVAMDGDIKLPTINSMSDLRQALQVLATVPAEAVQAVEILWTPQDESDTLSAREVLKDYPALRAL
eukprot:SM000212S06880  [mRNA]  locus=s212:44646:47005:+ [translate_table: standard]